MTAMLFNNVTDALSGAVLSGDPSITVSDGSKFTDPGEGNYFPLYIITESGAHEIVHVTSVNGDVLEVLRAQEGTDPLAFSGGEAVQVRPTRQSLAELAADNNTVDLGGPVSVKSALSERMAAFGTVGDMKDEARLQVGQKVRTLGYYAPGDGGGNDYEIVAAATGTEDGGSFIDLAGSGLQAKGLFADGVIRLEQFGGGDAIDSTAALKNAIAYASPGDEIRCQGAPIIRESITIDKTIKISFPASGLSNRFVFDTALPRTVQTFATHPDDGSDDAISAGFVIDAAAVEFENVIVDLFVDYSDNSATNFGTDIDIGILNLSRERMRLKGSRTRGYWRIAGLYGDCTQDNRTLDRAWITDCRFQGFWSIFIQGPKVKSTETEILAGDNRGRGGASDWNSERVWMEGWNHHSKVRRSDTDGGPLYIDGKLQPTDAIDAIQGRVWRNCRLDGADPYMLKIENAIRDKFESSFVDRKTGFLKTDGTTGVGTADCLVSLAAGAQHVVFDQTDIYAATLSIDSAATYQFNNSRDKTLSLVGERSFLPALAFGTGISFNSRSGRHNIKDNTMTFRIDMDVSALDNTDSSQVQIAGVPDILDESFVMAKVSVDTSNLLASPETAVVGVLSGGDLALWKAGGGTLKYTDCNTSGILRITGLAYV